MDTGLKSRTVLVTGATGGIGAATVRLLMKEGANTIAAGRNREQLTPVSYTHLTLPTIYSV